MSLISSSLSCCRFILPLAASGSAVAIWNIMENWLSAPGATSAVKMVLSWDCASQPDLSMRLIMLATPAIGFGLALDIDLVVLQGEGVKIYPIRHQHGQLIEQTHRYVAPHLQLLDELHAIDQILAPLLSSRISPSWVSSMAISCNNR